MQNAYKSNEWRKTLVHKTFEIEIHKREPNNSAVLQNWFPPRNLVPPLQFTEILKVSEKYSWIMQNALKSNEWRRIRVLENFKIEIQKGRSNNSDLLQNWFSPKIRSPSLMCRNFKLLREILLNKAECMEI